MQQRFLEPCRAVGVDAAAGRLTFLADDFSSAYRAFFRHAEGLPVGALCGDADNLRDDVATAFDDHRIAALYPQPLNLVLVVQRGPRHRHATHQYRLEMRYRSECSRASHLYFDILDFGDRLSGSILERDGPPGRLGGPAERELLFHAVDLDHHTVNFVGELFSLLFPLAAERQHLVESLAEMTLVVDLEAVTGQPFERFPLAGKRRPAVLLPAGNRHRNRGGGRR